MEMNYISAVSPAHIVSIANPHLCDAAGFFCGLIRATGYDGLPPPLCARCVHARTEEQLVRVVIGDAVEESTQGLVAFPPVAEARLRRRFNAS